MTVFKYKNSKLVKVAGNSGGGSGSTTPPDTELSETSTNSVQNKVITAALNNKANKFDVIEVMVPHGRTNDYLKEIQWFGTTMTFKYGFFDVSLSDTSKNAVQNKVITTELNKKLSNERVVLYSADLTSFAGQTITADLTPYKYIQILWRIVGGDVQYKSEIIPKEYDLSQTTINLLWDTILKRDFTMSSTGITFENGEQITAYGSSGPVTNNKVMIPFYIYGVK